ncbi:hypothetical protein BCR37DRAFT_385415 [Protomyces lactucae-debilis]|uniref:GST C-terminal domain-containing protein n=1 Tax=Protomyces lactucae-debilis TaxID=2754530 RepID=A0A1Y2FSI9_PROLT|nr:uncharacterized protein BCR37DRAFT_385415 [Protomyces lactucae-debilis]ORY86972.1 hypothetical protein BCR37DRAFT_385415 [Protomyces lactucae-debilis]
MVLVVVVNLNALELATSQNWPLETSDHSNKFEPQEAVMPDRSFDLWYWPNIPGRGEFIRVLFECSRIKGIHYTDKARLDGNADMDCLLPYFSHEAHELGPSSAELAGPFFAPPAIHDLEHDFWLSQTGNIVSYLAPIVNLVPNATYSVDMTPDKAARIQASVASRFSTLHDFSVEAHDSHHPIAMMSYYEEQRPQALLRAADFKKNRIPKFLGFIERCIEKNKQLWAQEKEKYPVYAEPLVGLDDEEADGAWFAYPRLTYADLALGFVMEGMQFAYPRCMGKLMPNYPLLRECLERINKLEALQAYKKSDRRPPLGDGLFRYYPEMDDEK